jgi:tetratricopeptide (TPR) repeat protein
VNKWLIIAAGIVLVLGAGLAALVLTGAWPGPSAADRERSRALFAEAQTLVQNGDQDAALAALNQSIELDSQNDALRLRSSLHIGRNDFDAALRDLDKVISRGGGLSENYSTRCWLRARGDALAGARTDCDRALEINPALASAFGNRGLVGLKQGRHVEAWQDFNEALRVGGDDEWVSWRLFGRGLAAWSKGDVTEGRHDAEQALRDNPRVAAEFLRFGVGAELLNELEGAAYAAATNEPSLLSLRQYLYVYPDGAHAADARAQMVEINAWIAQEEAAGQRTLPGFSLASGRGSAPSDDTFGAIAISRSTWRIAFVTDYAGPDEAEREAATLCNSGSVRDCDAYAFRNVCAALAISPRERTRGMAWAYGRDDAVHGAIDHCRTRGGRSCVAVHSACTPAQQETVPAGSP